MTALYRRAYDLAVHRARAQLVRELDEVARVVGDLRSTVDTPTASTGRRLAAAATEAAMQTANLAALIEAGAYLPEED